jgi:CubicO group peptidase (beta-lactamase class C family)
MRYRRTRTRSWSRLLVFILIAGGIALWTRAAPRAPAQWPTRAWPTSSPEAVGLDPTALQALDKEIAAGQYGYVDGILLIRHGRIALERHYAHDYDQLFVGKGAPGVYNYYDPEWHPFYKRTALHTMQSVSKSVTSTLIGIAISRGEIPNVDIRVMRYFSAFKILPDMRRDRMLLWNVLTMTTGIKWDESSATYTDPSNNCAQMEAADDWIQYVLDQPMAAEPGSAFVYNSGATELLSYIIRKTTGKDADDYAKEHLFGPLGIQQYYWKRTPKELADTEGGLYLQPRDLAKLGYLYLHDGMWDGKRILPAVWIRQSTRWSVDADRSSAGYGYQWWVLSRKGDATYEAYAAVGYGGQYLIVVPQLDLIAVFTGWNIYDKRSLSVRLALERAIGAAKD